MNSYGQSPKLGEKDQEERVTVGVITADTSTTPRDAYTSMARASYTNMVGRRMEYEEDRSETETLHRRALMYSGVGGVLFVVFLFFAAGLYSLQSIRLANIAFSLAFVGLLLFVTLTGIAFLTIFDMGKANDKELSQRIEGGDTRRSLANRVRLEAIKSTPSPLLAETEEWS